jgi:integrase
MTGITKRHSKGCASRNGRKCDCRAGYEAWVFSPRDNKKVRKTLPSHAAARAWRAQAQRDVRMGALRAAQDVTLRDASCAWLDGVREGAIRNRSGDPYKPSAWRGYEQALRLHVLTSLGAHKLARITTADLQALVERWQAAGMNPSTIRNALLPLRAIYRRACARDGLPVNPTSGLELPAVRGSRDRIASPAEAARLLTALPDEDRAIWATAMYAGLRLGELRALQDQHVDLKAGLIRVEASWDAREGLIAPKSRAGMRTVPIPKVLSAHLARHRLARGASGGLYFGRTPEIPFQPTSVMNRARRAWKAAGLEPVTLHECRHTFASLMIAAGVNAKALSTYMGHATISITLDRYGHLMPGNEAEAAGLLDAYLDRAAAGVSA